MDSMTCTWRNDHIRNPVVTTHRHTIMVWASFLKCSLRPVRPDENPVITKRRTFINSFSRASEMKTSRMRKLLQLSNCKKTV